MCRVKRWVKGECTFVHSGVKGGNFLGGRDYRLETGRREVELPLPCHVTVSPAKPDLKTDFANPTAD